MPNKTKRGSSNDGYFKNYKSAGLKEKHKQDSILKHLEKHPNDKQSVQRPTPDYKSKKKLS